MVDDEASSQSESTDAPQFVLLQVYLSTLAHLKSICESMPDLFHSFCRQEPQFCSNLLNFHCILLQSCPSSPSVSMKTAINQSFGICSFVLRALLGTESTLVQSISANFISSILLIDSFLSALSPEKIFFSCAALINLISIVFAKRNSFSEHVSPNPLETRAKPTTSNTTDSIQCSSCQGTDMVNCCTEAVCNGLRLCSHCRAEEQYPSSHQSTHTMARVAEKRRAPLNSSPALESSSDDIKTTENIDQVKPKRSTELPSSSETAWTGLDAHNTDVIADTLNYLKSAHRQPETQLYAKALKDLVKRFLNQLELHIDVLRERYTMV